MNSVTAEVAKKIGMFFQNDHGHPRSCQQITSHHARWSTTCDYTTRLQFFSHVFSIEYGPNWNESKHARRSASPRDVHV
jgi:hypothetical protein